MKTIDIVGIGMGADTLTAEGRKAIERADMLLGAKRMLDAFADMKKEMCPDYTPEGIRKAVETSPHQYFAVLVSGDTGFYSAAEGIGKALGDTTSKRGRVPKDSTSRNGKAVEGNASGSRETSEDYDVRFIPGISSLNYFFSKIHRSWQDAALVSCHGRDANLADTVRRNRLTFALTGGNTASLAKQLVMAGFGDLQVTVGENMGMPDERIIKISATALEAAGIGKLAVLLIENPQPDARVFSGIPDAAFIRGGIPMTKSEIRAVSMSRLAVAPDDICCDIGAGTGSVTVEMGLAAWCGRVFAIEEKEEGVRLIHENCAAFHLGNVTVIRGTAPDALSGMPKLSAAFIGGSGGKLDAIIEALLKNNPDIRIVINAITLETVQKALLSFRTHGIEEDVVQISVSKARPAGKQHMMTAQNPVFVIAGNHRGQEGMTVTETGSDSQPRTGTDFWNESASGHDQETLSGDKDTTGAGTGNTGREAHAMTFSRGDQHE